MRGVNIVSLATHLYGVRQTYTGRPAHESRQHEVPQYIEGRRDATSRKTETRRLKVSQGCDKT